MGWGQWNMCLKEIRSVTEKYGGNNPKTNQNPNLKASKEEAKNSNKKLNIVDLVLIYYLM